METSEGPKISRRVILAGAAGIGAFAALGKVQGAEAQTSPAISTLTPQQIQDRAEEVQKAQDRAKAEQARIVAQTSQISPVHSPVAQASQESSHPPPGSPGSKAIVTLPVVGPVDNRVLITVAAVLTEVARGGKDLRIIKKIWDRRKKEGDAPEAGTTAGEKGRHWWHWWQRGEKEQAKDADEAQPQVKRIIVKRGDCVQLPDGTFKLLAEVFTTPIPRLAPEDQALLVEIQRAIVRAEHKVFSLPIDDLRQSLLTNKKAIEALIKDAARAGIEIKLVARDPQLAEQITRATQPNEQAYREIESLGISVNSRTSVDDLMRQLIPWGWRDDQQTRDYVQSAISFFQKQSAISSAS